MLGRKPLRLGHGEDLGEVARPRPTIRRSASSRRRAAGRVRRADHICGCSRRGSMSLGRSGSCWPTIGELHIAVGDQMDLDPRQDVVPARVVAEGVDGNVPVELAVDAGQQVERELRRSRLRDRRRRRSADRRASPGPCRSAAARRARAAHGTAAAGRSRCAVRNCRSWNRGRIRAWAGASMPPGKREWPREIGNHRNDLDPGKRC